MTNTAYRYFTNDETGLYFSTIFTWASNNLTSEESADFNSAFERNTERYNYLIEMNYMGETLFSETFYSNYLQTNITAPVGTLITYDAGDGPDSNFLKESRWEYWVSRHSQST